MLNNSLEYSLFPSFSPSSNRVMRTLLICTKNPAHARTKLLNQPHSLKYAHQLTIAWHTAAVKEIFDPLDRNQSTIGCHNNAIAENLKY